MVNYVFLGELGFIHRRRFLPRKRFSPNSVSILRGSYGNGKSQGWIRVLSLSALVLSAQARRKVPC